MNFKTGVELLKETWTEWNEDKAPRLGAAFAYYTLFSMAPLLVVIIAMAGFVFGQAAAQGEIAKQIEATVGADAARSIQDMVSNAGAQKGTGIFATVMGLITLLAGAAGLFGQLQDALNTIWEVAPKPGQGFVATLKNRFLSFAMVLGTGFILLVSLVLSAALAALGKWMDNVLPVPEVVLQAVTALLSFGVTTLLFAMIYRVLPDVEIAWRDVWTGAAITSLLFTLGKFGLGLYLGKSGVASAYGAAGSLVLILLWVYYSAQILFFGAEFTQVYANKFGSHVKPAPNAVPVTAEARAQQGMPSAEDLDGATPAPKPSAVPVPAVANAMADDAQPMAPAASNGGSDLAFTIVTLAGLAAGMYIAAKRQK